MIISTGAISDEGDSTVGIHLDVPRFLYKYQFSIANVTLQVTRYDVYLLGLILEADLFDAAHERSVMVYAWGT